MDAKRISYHDTRFASLKERDSEQIPSVFRGAYEGSIGLDEADIFLNQSDMDGLFLRLMRKGEEIAKHEYVESVNDMGAVRDRIDKKRFFNLLSNGCAVVMNRIDLRSDRIRQLTRALGASVEAAATANGYLSLNGDGAFGCHWDTHDVFAVQLHGAKRWKVFRPTFKSPLNHQRSSVETFEENDLFLDTILYTGDILYIPRGWWHRTIASEGASFHIACGTHRPKFLDYFMWALAEKLSLNEKFRHTFQMESAMFGKACADELSDIIQVICTSGELRESFINAYLNADRSSPDINLSMFFDQTEFIQRAGAITANTIRQDVNTSSCITLNGVKMTLDEDARHLLSARMPSAVPESPVANTADSPDVNLNLMRDLWLLDVLTVNEEKGNIRWTE
jgi:ribosomal protein L16 Arg81 hydroxylase